ncbi:MAG: hypothetical protein JXL84_19920 [Deltaproteobacteria bacterium]|nr:hypothetical protein [Deltaproteobacteria bacterium]
MKKIVRLEDRIESKKQKERLERYRGKMGTIQKLLQCSSCHLKCAMCGAQIQSPEAGCHAHPGSGRLQFCQCCREEFQEFISITKGQREPTLFWHNEEWKAMWSAWLEYRKAMTAFLRSKEFRLLLEELEDRS